MAANSTTRELWLTQLASQMKPIIEDRAEIAIPAFRVTCGFPSQRGLIGYKTRVCGECWCSTASDDLHAEICISPVEDDPNKIAAILAHELIHAALPHVGHKRPFQTAAKAIGHTRPFTSSIATDEFLTWTAPLLGRLPDYPHKRLNAVRPGMRLKDKPTPGTGDRPVENEPEDEEELPPIIEDGEAPIILVADRKRQKNRHFKCECQSCGYITRTSRKWIEEAGPPHCPKHGPMAYGDDLVEVDAD